ncbi:MAG: TolB family protein [Candidatus Sericytochromatia bacterium]
MKILAGLCVCACTLMACVASQDLPAVRQPTPTPSMAVVEATPVPQASSPAVWTAPVAGRLLILSLPQESSSWGIQLERGAFQVMLFESGQVPRLLLPHAFKASVVWSPDSEQFTYMEVSPDQRLGLGVYDLRTGTRSLVSDTVGKLESVTPFWSWRSDPATASSEGVYLFPFGSGAAEMYLYQPGVQPARKLTGFQSVEGPSFQVSQPDWFAGLEQGRPVSKVAYVAGTEDNAEIFVSDLTVQDGPLPLATNLTRHAAQDTQPKWSPDGRHVLFLSTREGVLEPFLMNAEGRDIRRLLVQAPQSMELEFADWSPDGQQVVLVYRGDIYVVQADGSGLRLLTSESGLGYNRDPVWSPDSRQIAFVSHLNEGGSDVFVVQADGSGLLNLTHSLKRLEAAVLWAPAARGGNQDEGF